MHLYCLKSNIDVHTDPCSVLSPQKCSPCLYTRAGESSLNKPSDSTWILYWYCTFLCTSLWTHIQTYYMHNMPENLSILYSRNTWSSLELKVKMTFLMLRLSVTLYCFQGYRSKMIWYYKKDSLHDCQGLFDFSCFPGVCKRMPGKLSIICFLHQVLLLNKLPLLIMNYFQGLAKEICSVV